MTLPTTGFQQGDIHWNKSTYSQEEASPGYYKYHQDYYQTTVEATATERTTLMKLTYHKTNNTNFIIDLFHSEAKARDAMIESFSPTSISGWGYNGDFCGKGTRQKGYFHLEVNKPPNKSLVIIRVCILATLLIPTFKAARSKGPSIMNFGNDFQFLHL